MQHSIYFPLLFLITILASPLHAQRLPDPLPGNQRITIDELRAHVQWLSSDELEGRGTGSAAIDRAAEYLAREFKRFGLEPAGEDGYFQTFEVVTGARRNACTLTINRGGGAEAVDTLSFIPYAFSASGAFSGRLAFAGYGIAGGHGEASDYDGIDAAGAVVLALHGMPEDTDPHSGGALQATARSKALSAREAGASA